MIKEDTYKEMIKVKSDILIPTYNGKKGHPILVNSTFINEIITSDDYKSLRDFVEKHKFTTIELQDKGILMDIDTVEDYKNVISSYLMNKLKKGTIPL